MGKYSNFPSQTLKVRPQSAIHTPKRVDEYPRHFYNGVAPPPPRPLLTTIPRASWAIDSEAMRARGISLFK